MPWLAPAASSPRTNGNSVINQQISAAAPSTHLLNACSLERPFLARLLVLRYLRRRNGAKVAFAICTHVSRDLLTCTVQELEIPGCSEPEHREDVTVDDTALLSRLECSIHLKDPPAQAAYAKQLDFDSWRLSGELGRLLVSNTIER